jgi:GNAT superfamily N-acetyltransferase
MLTRLIAETDFDGLVALARRGVADHLPQHKFNEQKLRGVLAASLATADPTVFVVETSVGLVGFAAVSLADYPYTTGFFATVDVVYVRPDKRGTRAAALLVRSVVDWADHMGAKETFAGPATGFQVEQTSRLLQRFGFNPVGCVLRRGAGL